MIPGKEKKDVAHTIININVNPKKSEYNATDTGLELGQMVSISKYDWPCSNTEHCAATYTTVVPPIGLYTSSDMMQTTGYIQTMMSQLNIQIVTRRR